MNNLLGSYIDVLKNKSSHEVIEYLKNESSLGVNEKNLVYLYLFPRPLLDMELPKRIIDSRLSQGNSGVGFLEYNLIEIALLVEAYKTKQYERFMRHLFHTFTVPENISPINGYSKCECGLCKKQIFELGAWESEIKKYKNSDIPEKTRKEYLAFGGIGSNLSLCIDCIIQLQGANEAIEDIEPGYLRNRYHS